MEPYVIDTTLRDGEQAPGVVFSKKEKLKIAALLNDLGVDEVEVGTPAISNEEKKIIKTIASQGFSYKTSSWCRAHMKDIEEASKLGTDCINISLPVSDVQIKTLCKSRVWVLSMLKETTSYAASLFSHVTVGAQDATRSNLDFLNDYIFYAQNYGAKRIRIADTVGIISPLEVHKLFTDLVIDFPTLQFEFHGHNDLGMATANAITAYKSGVKCISATVNGLGERAGNSVLEEFIGYLVCKEHNTKYNSKVISKLCKTVSKISNQAIPVNKPLIGEKVYTHESGIHTSAIIKDRSSYQFINPEDFGQKDSDFCFGKHSGKASVNHFLKENNLYFDDMLAQSILNAVKQQSTNLKRALTDIDVMNIYNQSRRLI